MNPDRPTPTDRAPLDDAALAVLIREVADEWSLPPQRLDALTWRDRVGRGRRAGNGGSGGRWTRLVLGAAAVAVVATVSLSFAVGWLKAPPSDQGTVGTSPSPGASSIPVHVGGPAGRVAAAEARRNGDLPTPSRIMVQTGQGYHIADLATGDLSPVLIEVGHGPTAVLARPGGGWVCICGDGQNAIRLSLRPSMRNGVVGAATPFKDIVGTEDPSESGDLQPFLADVSVTASPDGRLGLVGWIYRDGEAGWQIGADLIDLETLADGRLDPAPSRPTDRRRWPRALAIRSDRARLARRRSDPPRDPGVRRRNGQRARLVRRALGGVVRWTIDRCPGQRRRHDPRRVPRIRRRADRRRSDRRRGGLLRLVLVAVRFAAGQADRGGWSVGERDRVPGQPGRRSTREAWCRPPATPSIPGIRSKSVLSRLDLRNGELSVGEPQSPNPTGLTNGQGDLIVVSADGTRVYTLGIASADTARTPEAPQGSMRSTPRPSRRSATGQRWRISTSIAVSEDGRHVYAAATGGPTAAGDPGAGVRRLDHGLRHIRRLGRRSSPVDSAHGTSRWGRRSAAEARPWVSGAGGCSRRSRSGRCPSRDRRSDRSGSRSCCTWVGGRWPCGAAFGASRRTGQPPT